MKLAELFPASQVHYHEGPVQSLRQLFELIGQLVVHLEPSANPTLVLQALAQRERLGSTYIGHGVAIPHAKLTELSQPVASLIRLASPMNYDPNSSKSADLIFSLLIPENESELHLQILSELVEHINQTNFRNRLRRCTSSQELHQSLIQSLSNG